ncbi:hypothetical protein PT2222_550001 [Paraburkholderia tropica]
MLPQAPLGQQAVDLGAPQRASRTDLIVGRAVEIQADGTLASKV